MPDTVTSYSTFSPSTKARSSLVNTNFSNHRGTVLPINTDTATASDDTHNLGSTDHNFKKVFVASGFFTTGMIMPIHRYNGTVAVPQGWMRADGRVINEANYNTEHNAGDWATYVESSPLDGLYLPDLVSRYVVGVSATTQGGTATISSVGNTSNTSDLSHTHVGGEHNHQWHADGNRTWNSAGTTISVDTFNDSQGASGIIYGPLAELTSTFSSVGNNYTDNQSPTTGSTLSTTTSIQPDSIEAEYYMRII